MRRGMTWVALWGALGWGCDDGTGGSPPVGDAVVDLGLGADRGLRQDGDVPDAGPDGAPADAALPDDMGPEVDADHTPDAEPPDAQPCEPSPEVCDGLDQDCDGAVDEALGTQPCDEPGACARGMAACEDGAWRCGAQPGQERCDGELDEDCDGAVDEGCDCPVGERQPCGDDTGACVAGEQWCVEICDGDGCSATWGPCDGEVAPVDETCDGTDEDCDGAVDEGLARGCGVDEGVCVAGVSTCQAGEWGACEGEIGPAAERCSGADDDCDGVVDEGALIAEVRLEVEGLSPRVFALGGALAVTWERDTPNGGVDDDVMLGRFDWDGNPLGEPQVLGRIGPGAGYLIRPTGDGAWLILDEKPFAQPDAPAPCEPETPHLFRLNGQGEIVETVACGALLRAGSTPRALVSGDERARLLLGRDGHSLVTVFGARDWVYQGDVGGAATVSARWHRPGREAPSVRLLDGARSCPRDDVPACGTPAAATAPGGLAVALRDADVLRISRANLAGDRLGDAVEVPADGVPLAVDLGDTAWVLWGTDQLRRARVDEAGIEVLAPLDVNVGTLVAAAYDGRWLSVYGRRDEAVWAATVDRDGAVVAPPRAVYGEVEPERYVGRDVRAWLGELGVAAQGDRRAWLVTDNREWQLQIDGVTPCSPPSVCGDEPPACDGVDGDCDGVVDEGAEPQACRSALPGACAEGAGACGRCQPEPAQPEAACGGVDGDCDGAADERPVTADEPVCLNKDVLVCGDPRYQNFCGGRERVRCLQSRDTVGLPDGRRILMGHAEIDLGAFAVTAELDGQPETRRLVTVRRHRQSYPERYRAAGVAGGALWLALITPEQTGLLSPRELSFDLIRVPIQADGLGAPVETPLPVGDLPSDGFNGQWEAAPTLAVGDDRVAIAWSRPDIEARPGSVWLGLWDHAGAPVFEPRERVLADGVAVQWPKLVPVPGGFLLLAAVRIANPPDEREGNLEDGYRIRAWPVAPDGTLGQPQLVAELQYLATWDSSRDRYRTTTAGRFDAAAGDQGVLVVWTADPQAHPAVGVQAAFIGFDGRPAVPRVDRRPVAGDFADLGLRVRAVPGGFRAINRQGDVIAFGPDGGRQGRQTRLTAWTAAPGIAQPPLDFMVDGGQLWAWPRTVQAADPPRIRLDPCE